MTIGALAAILSIPYEIGPESSLTPSAIMLAFSLLIPTIPSWRNDMRSLLRGENILIIALIYWSLFEVLQGGYSPLISRDAVVSEYVLLTITALGFWLGANISRPLAPNFLRKEALQPMGPTAIFGALIGAFALGVWDFIYRSDFNMDTVLAALLQSRWNSPWQRESLGDWSAFSYHLQYFGYLVPPMTILLALRAGWKDPRTWLGICMSLSILAFHAQGGGRRIVGSMILAGMFCWLVQVRRLNFNRLVVTLVIFGTLAALLQVMLIYRGIGFSDEWAAFPQYDKVFVDDNFFRIGQMLEFVPDTYPFVGTQYVLYALVRPIPRVLWPDKPISGGFDLAEIIGIPDTSLALTVAGELYVSYGYLAVLLGAFIYGRLSTMVNFLFLFEPSKLNPLFPSLLMVWLFVGVRSMLEIMLMGYVLLAVIALSKSIRFMNSLRPGVGRRSGLPNR